MAYIIIPVLLMLISHHSAQDDCCPGETWTNCPPECVRKIIEKNRCCTFNELCGAGSGCISKKQMEEDLISLRDEISVSKCTYYEELLRIYKCGGESFASQYGKSCFSSIQSQGNFEDLEFLGSVRKCLQSKMSDDLERHFKDKGSITCDKVKEIGFSSVALCNVRPSDGSSFCKLNLSDQYKLTSLALKQSYDSKYDSLSVGQVILVKCGNTSEVINYGRERHLSEYTARRAKSREIVSKVRYGNHEGNLQWLLEYSETILKDNSLKNAPQADPDARKLQSKFSYFEVSSNSTDLVIPSFHNVKLKEFEYLSAKSYLNSFDSSIIDGFIGLGPNSTLINRLHAEGEIDHKGFYFIQYANFTILPVLGKLPPSGGIKSDCSIKDEWSCLVKSLRIGDPHYDLTPAENVFVKFDYHMSDFLYFSYKPLDMLDLFLSRYLRNSTSCFAVQTSSLLINIACEQDFNIKAISDLVIELDNTAYLIKKERLFEKEGKYITLKAHFQLNHNDEENTIYIGTDLIAFDYIFYDLGHQKMILYGGQIAEYYKSRAHVEVIVAIVIVLVIIILLVIYFCYCKERKPDRSSLMNNIGT